MACVGSGVMGSSDGFESKKLGVPAPGEHCGAGRDSALSPFTGLGESGANLVEVHGVIKWFDASKGYGFIVPDNGWPDVLLHVTVLRRVGFQTAYEGARVICECVLCVLVFLVFC